MGLNPHMQNLTMAKIKLKDLVERFDVIVITEKLLESLVLLAQRNRFAFYADYFARQVSVAVTA